MIQDIYPHKLDNHFDIDAKPDNDSIVLYFTKEGILHKLSSYKDYENYLFFPTVQDFITKDGTFPFEKDALTYLFSVDDAHYFLLEQEPAQLPKGFTFTPIRNLRKKKQITQIDLAVMIGIDRAYLSEIENGRTNVSLNVLYAIADALNTNITCFFNENRQD